jgi:hypothetical protein
MRLRIALFAILIFCLIGFTGCSKSNNEEQPTSSTENMSGTTAEHKPSLMQRAMAPKKITVPAGTIITVQLGSSISTKTARAGDNFSASVAQPVSVNGEVVIPSGSNATGTVTDSKGMGHFKGGALLAITLNSVDVKGASYQVQTSPSEHSISGKGKRSAVIIGGGAGLGALVGGLAGGGKGAAIGAAAGAGAGTAGAAFTGNKDIVLPAESTVSFKLLQPVDVKM